MRVNVSQALSHQAPVFDKFHHLFMLYLGGHGEGFKEKENFNPVLKGSASEFADDEWMTDDVAVIQQRFKSGLSFPQMGHPHRCVDKNHSTCLPSFCEGSPSISFRRRRVGQASCCFPWQSTLPAPVEPGRSFPKCWSVSTPYSVIHRLCLKSFSCCAPHIFFFICI